MKKLLAMLLLSIVIMSCDDNTVETNEPIDNSIYSLLGTLNNVNNVDIPDNAIVGVVWIVSSGSPDYGYLWTTGKLDLENNNFKIQFDTNPLDSCLNYYDDFGFGVGMILLLDNSKNDITEGVIEFDTDVIIGAINDRAIIYPKDNYKTKDFWIKDFEEGFNFGKGWYNPDHGFDGWEPTGIEGIELKIDDFENFVFPNWT